MNRICKRITALILVLLMTASLLASCSGEGGEKPKRESDKSIPIYDSYAGSVVDIGLTENETVLDIIEVDGELRATIGVTNVKIEEIYGAGLGTPYQTEYRYYSADFVENSSKREKSIATHEITTLKSPLTLKRISR